MNGRRCVADWRHGLSTTVHVALGRVLASLPAICVHTSSLDVGIERRHGRRRVMSCEGIASLSLTDGPTSTLISRPTSLPTLPLLLPPTASCPALLARSAAAVSSSASLPSSSLSRAPLPSACQALGSSIGGPRRSIADRLAWEASLMIARNNYPCFIFFLQILFEKVTRLASTVLLNG
ncbi:hypothetical protein BU24DRAFT_101236 [Aaosphaeria arxii CBS 175.79]|uniref:Uncharacterized protein n=1 Tax=Aaosphaeria arxii CBS 175.79 TaxID=1450172 RepID=A0A6A5XZA7_9PLEO|nr:uncharacterized protein BU24DRAFT_101236 [Aaosphaeria arxii CBS 175.79]KAF2018638.1 hypothetical protein BU24DRAFT_101236 [Aaosphaeria arxii CBS 175.79]